MTNRYLFAFAGALLLAACGGDSTAPPVPASLSIAQGDDQGGIPGDSLTLRVLVLAANGSPAGGAVVAWAVTSGDATVAPASIAADAAGSASAAVRFGTTAGPVTVNATVAGVAAATFSLMNDPCNYLPIITLGVTTTGRLSGADCQFSDGTAIDFYDLAVAGQQNILFTMTSATYRGFVFLFDASGKIIGATVDDPVGDASVARAILAPGRYLISPNAYNVGAFGNYSMAAVAQPLDGGCPLTWAIRGIDVMQTTAGSPCAWAGATSGFEHFLWFADLNETRSFTVDVTAAGFAATVIIGDGQLITRATGTASAPGQTATATYSPVNAHIQAAGPIFYIEIQGAGSAALPYRLVVR